MSVLALLRAAELSEAAQGTQYYRLLLFPMSGGDDKALRARLKALFDQFDTDGGGEIDTAELGKVMEKLGQHCTEAELHVCKPLTALHVATETIGRCVGYDWRGRLRC